MTHRKVPTAAKMSFVNRITTLAFFAVILSTVVHGIRLPIFNNLADKTPPSLSQRGLIHACQFENATNGTTGPLAAIQNCWDLMDEIRMMGDGAKFHFGSCSGNKQLVGNQGCSFGMEAIDQTCTTKAAVVGPGDVLDMINKSVSDFGGAQGYVGAEGYLSCPDGSSNGGLVGSKWRVYREFPVHD